MPMSIINPTDFDRHFDCDFISLILLICPPCSEACLRGPQCCRDSLSWCLTVAGDSQVSPLSVSYNIVVMEAWGRLEDMWDLRNGALISSSNIIHFNYENFS